MLSLTYIGHSAFALSDGTHSVLVDPFITGNPVATVTAEDFSPQTILLTHAHNDHMGDTVPIAKRAGSHVVALFEIANWLGSQGVEKTTGGNMGGTIPFAGGTVKFTPAWHTSSYQDAAWDACDHAAGWTGGAVRRQDDLLCRRYLPVQRYEADRRGRTRCGGHPNWRCVHDGANRCAARGRVPESEGRHSLSLRYVSRQLRRMRLCSSGKWKSGRACGASR